MIFTKRCFIIIFMLCYPAAHAQDRNRLTFDYRFSDDSEDASFMGPIAGYDRLFSNRQYFGVGVGERTYDELIAPDSAEFKELQIRGRKNFSETIHAEGSLSYLDKQDWSPFVFNFYGVYDPASKWRFEAYLEKSLLGTTIAAIDEKISVLVGGVVAEYAFNEKMTMVTNFTRMNFSDSNDRNRQALTFIYSPGWTEGLSFRADIRNVDSRFNPREYFSPDNFQQYMASARLVRPLDNDRQWWLFVEGGVGRQYINNTGEEAFRYRISLEGPLTRHLHLSLEHMCSTDGGNYNYRYCAGNAGISYYW